jgi:hypothetical protein
MRFIVVNSNCQDMALANCMKIMFGVNMVSLVAKADAASAELGSHDVVICQEQHFSDSWRERTCRSVFRDIFRIPPRLGADEVRIGFPDGGVSLVDLSRRLSAGTFGGRSSSLV